MYKSVVEMPTYFAYLKKGAKVGPRSVAERRFIYFTPASKREKKLQVFAAHGVTSDVLDINFLLYQKRETKSRNVKGRKQ